MCSVSGALLGTTSTLLKLSTETPVSYPSSFQPERADARSKDSSNDKTRDSHFSGFPWHHHSSGSWLVCISWHQACAEVRWQSNWCSCSRVRNRASTSICFLTAWPWTSYPFITYVYGCDIYDWSPERPEKGVRSLTPEVVESCMHHAVAKDLTCILCKSSWWSWSH